MAEFFGRANFRTAVSSRPAIGVTLLVLGLAAAGLPTQSSAQTPTGSPTQTPTQTPTPTTSPPSTAVANLIDETGRPVGSVQFQSFGGTHVRLRVGVSGLSPGWHGFHVHDVGTCEPPSFGSAGGHYNPGNSNHANHAGDMPPLFAQQNGTASATFTTDRFSVGELLAADVAVVIHAGPDNLANIPTQDIVGADGSYSQRAYYYKPDPAANNFVAGAAPDTTLRTGDAGGRRACGRVQAAAHPFPEPTPPLPGAQVDLVNEQGTGAGRVTFAETGNTVEVQVNASGLAPGFHGFHVHDVGSCEPPSFASAGGHYNPEAANHPSHRGDTPVLFAKEDGTASATFTTDRFSVSELLAADVAVVVHANPDNFANIPAQDVTNPDGTYSQRAYYYKPDPSVNNFVAGPASDTTLRTGDAGGRRACGPVRDFRGSPTSGPTQTATARTPTQTGTAATPIRAERDVNLEASTNRTTFGRRVRLSATVSSDDASGPGCTAGVEVVLSRRISGSDTTREVETATTDASGVAKFLRRADRSAGYTASVSASTTCAAANSGVEPVLVRKLVRLRLSPRGSVPPGTDVGVTVQVKPCGRHAGDRVALYQGRGGTLPKVASRSTNARCSAFFKRNVRRTTTFQARSPKQDADHLGGRSRRKTIEVP
ncbi:MAG: superoxide dismutase family protein [Actinomycetota bacterium]